MKLFLYILVMAGTTYLIRMIPFTLMRKKIRSRFFRSLLYYLPYAVLSAMTFPAILYATGSVLASAGAALLALVLSFAGLPMTVTAIAAAGLAFILALI